MSPLVEAFRALVARHTPRHLDWNLTHPAVSLVDGKVQLCGALPTTMHFGRTTLELESGRLSWVDEDHRDGGELLVHSVTLPSAELDALRALS
ncbi:MAG: hypothetical protein ACOZQL_13610 [Myxococcota bacterium]